MKKVSFDPLYEYYLAGYKLGTEEDVDIKPQGWDYDQVCAAWDGYEAGSKELKQQEQTQNPTKPQIILGS
jgi:hypothetical protein